MSPSPLAPWRDLSIIWLSIIPMILLVIVVVVLVFALRGILAVKRWVRLPLLYGQLWALRIQQSTERVCGAIVEVPIRVHSRSAQVRVTLSGGVDYLRGA